MSDDNATPPAPVTRRRFLAHVAAAAATPSLVVLAADAALARVAPAHAAKKHAPPVAPPAASAEAGEREFGQLDGGRLTRAQHAAQLAHGLIEEIGARGHVSSPPGAVAAGPAPPS